MACKAFMFARVVGALLVASLASAGSASPSGVLFEQVKDVIASQVDPDAIEMARFSIAYPEDAAKIYSRATAQDYPFFGLVGAVKVARKAGFTHGQCLFPITSIDTVFSKASDHVTQGAAQTEGAMHTASSIASEYAKAQSDQAKKQLEDKLAEMVPYFGDIGTICNFAFETDFTIDDDIQRVAGQTSQDVRAAYLAFEEGDVVTGVDILLSLGADSAIACKMVDSAVGGGVIGRTPILGALAKNACSGFAGAVIDGAKGLVKGGVGLVEAGVTALADTGGAVACKVYSWIGNGCSGAEPPPPANALQNGTAWCAPHGGVAGFLSKTNQPNDYKLECNDGSRCSAKPGRVAHCATGAEIAARRAQEAALAHAQFLTRLPQWEAEFVARWGARCPDESCRAGIRSVRFNATILAMSEHAAKPRLVFQTLTYYIFEAADRQALAVVEDTSYRLLPPRWAEGFKPRWNERCEDNQCRAGITFVATGALVQVKQKAGLSPRPPYGGNAAIYWAAEDHASGLVVESVLRMADLNQKNTAAAATVMQKVVVDVWGRDCSDALCFRAVTRLAEELRAAMNHLQALHPDKSSMAIMTMVGPGIGLKAKAAADESRARVAAKAAAIPVFTARRVGPIRPFLQPGRGPLARGTVEPPSPRRPTDSGGRPPPRPVPPVRPMPSPRPMGGAAGGAG